MASLSSPAKLSVSTVPRLIIQTSASIAPGGTLAIIGAGQVTTPAVGLTNNGLITITGPGMVNFLGQITGTGTLALNPAASLVSDGIVATSLQLGLNATHTIRPNTGGTTIATGASDLSTLTLAGSPGNWSSKLDITNNALIIQATDPTDKANKIATLQNQIAQAMNGGTWTGTGGITSSTVAASSTHALGLALADNLTLEYTTFAGQSVDANSLILVAAHVGDSTLDGKVDIQDLNKVVAHWQHTGLLWSDGDTTGPQGIPDGNVDIQDLNAVVANWQLDVGSGLATGSSSALQHSRILSISLFSRPRIRHARHARLGHSHAPLSPTQGTKSLIKVLTLLACRLAGSPYNTPLKMPSITHLHSFYLRILNYLLLWTASVLFFMDTLVDKAPLPQGFPGDFCNRCVVTFAPARRPTPVSLAVVSGRSRLWPAANECALTPKSDYYVRYSRAVAADSIVRHTKTLVERR